MTNELHLGKCLENEHEWTYTGEQEFGIDSVWFHQVCETCNAESHEIFNNPTIELVS